MFSGEHPFPFYLFCIYSLYFLLLIYCYMCCDALVSVPMISLAALYCLGHILLPIVWSIVGLARRSRLLKCCCVSSSATVVDVLPHVDVRDDHSLLNVHFNSCLTTKIEVSRGIG